MPRILVLTVVAALVAAAPAHAQKKKRDRPPDKVEVQLLGINDFHGHLEADTPGMATRQVRDARAVQAAQEDYIRSVAGSSGGAADQLEKLAALHDAGKLTDEEFQAQKTKLLA